MTCRLYEVTVTGYEESALRVIIAHSTVQAMLTALRSLPGQTIVKSITCKPLCQLTDEEEPCAA